MARTVDQFLSQQIGALSLQIAQLAIQLEQATERLRAKEAEVAALKAPKPDA